MRVTAVSKSSGRAVASSRPFRYASRNIAMRASVDDGYLTCSDPMEWLANSHQKSESSNWSQSSAASEISSMRQKIALDTTYVQ